MRNLQIAVEKFVGKVSINLLYETGYAKRGLVCTHFKSHFSPPFDRYNNKLTVHACTIAKGSTVYFYGGLIHGLFWHPSVLGWSVNSSNFPSQADSRQGITRGLAGETGHRCSYIVTCGAENSLN